MSITKLLRVAPIALLSLACAAAYADSTTVEFQTASAVRFSDLNLSRPADVARLYERIATAADKLCGPRSLTGSYSKSGIYQSCYEDAVAQAVARVNQARLTAYYRQRVQPTSYDLSIARK
jgi:UrcA family protein